MALYHLGELKESLELYDQSILLDDEDARTFFNRGNTYLALGENQKAQSDFDRAIALQPNNSKFYHSKGLAHQDLGECHQAI